MSRDRLTQVVVFILLVSIAVVGRWGRPDWCVTPLAATGLLAGWWFRHAVVAMLVPLAAMVVSDLGEASYSNWGVLAAVYGCLAVAPLWGRLVRRSGGGVGRWALASVTPALVFFVVTNFAVWAFEAHYPATLAGLLQCYAAAVPFLWRMLAGDVVYTALLLGAAALAELPVFGSTLSPARS